MIDGDTVFEPDTVRPLVAAVRRPDGRRGVGQRQGRATATSSSARLAAHRVRRRLQHRPPRAGHHGLHDDRARRGRRVPPRGAAARSAASATDTLAEDTDLTMALGRAGWRVVYEERARAWTEAPATLGAAVAAALPLELRHDAGDVEAPRGRCVETGRRGQGRARAGCALAAVPDPPAAHRAAGRRLPPLRPGVRSTRSLTLLLGAGMLAVQLLHGVVRVPAGARAARRAVGVPRAADRLPAADVLGAHPVGRDRGERRRRALAADEPHRRAEQPAAEAVRRARPGSGQRPHLGARAAQQERDRAAQGEPVDLGHRARRRGDRPRALARPVEGRGIGPGDRLGRAALPRTCRCSRRGACCSGSAAR